MQIPRLIFIYTYSYIPLELFLISWLYLQCWGQGELSADWQSWGMQLWCCEILESCSDLGSNPASPAPSWVTGVTARVIRVSEPPFSLFVHTAFGVERRNIGVVSNTQKGLSQGKHSAWTGGAASKTAPPPEAEPARPYPQEGSLERQPEGSDLAFTKALDPSKTQAIVWICNLPQNSPRSPWREEGERERESC